MLMFGSVASDVSDPVLPLVVLGSSGGIEIEAMIGTGCSIISGVVEAFRRKGVCQRSNVCSTLGVAANSWTASFKEEG